MVSREEEADEMVQFGSAVGLCELLRSDGICTVSFLSSDLIANIHSAYCVRKAARPTYCIDEAWLYYSQLKL